MSTPRIELAGGVTMADVNASRRGILARAPAWWRNLAMRNGAATAVLAAPASESVGVWHYGADATEPKQSQRYCGWLSGCVAPSVAVPCFNHADKLRVREQFTPDCWQMVLEQFRRGKYPITLQYRHNGESLASTSDISLTFALDRICGLQFDAKLRDDPLGRSIIKAASGKGLAVSIAYKRGKGWTVDREGGTVRVINECIVDHVAVLPESQSPAYRGARCYGAATQSRVPPSELQRDARIYAWREIKRQAGAEA